MIVTVTPNPSLDRTYELPALHRGEVLRATATAEQAGGKGVNVARALTRQGHRARAVLPVGGAAGQRLLDLIDRERLERAAVAVTGETRTNVSLVEPDGVVTKVNDPGAVVDADDLAALRRAVDEALAGAAWLAASGSLPPGVDDGLYAELVAAAHARGVPAAVDASGPSLVAALAAGPDVVKPNEDELAEATGRELRSLGDVLEAAEQMRLSGAAQVLVSLGADGAVLVDATGALHATTPPITARSAVGAGDTLLAGFLAADAHGPAALRRAVAWGAAAAALPGTSVPGPGDVDEGAVDCHDLDPERILGARSRTA